MTLFQTHEATMVKEIEERRDVLDFHRNVLEVRDLSERLAVMRLDKNFDPYERAAAIQDLEHQVEERATANRKRWRVI